MRRRTRFRRALLLCAGVLVVGAAPASAAAATPEAERPAERSDAHEAPALAFLGTTLVASGVGVATVARRRPTPD